MSRAKKETEANELLEMRIVLRDGKPEASLFYHGVVVKKPMLHIYGIEAAFDIWNAVAPWIPDRVLERHAPNGGD